MVLCFQSLTGLCRTFVSACLFTHSVCVLLRMSVCVSDVTQWRSCVRLHFPAAVAVACFFFFFFVCGVERGTDHSPRATTLLRVVCHRLTKRLWGLESRLWPSATDVVCVLSEPLSITQIACFAASFSALCSRSPSREHM
jgi:hypothetical protein